MNNGFNHFWQSGLDFLWEMARSGIPAGLLAAVLVLGYDALRRFR